MLVDFVGNGIASMVCMEAGNWVVGCVGWGSGVMRWICLMGWAGLAVLCACEMDWICFDEVEDLFVVYDYTHHPLVDYP